MSTLIGIADVDIPAGQSTHKTLKSRIQGAVLVDGDRGYDEAKTVWNGLHDRRPAYIVQPAVVADVIEAVRFARDNDLALSAKGGATTPPVMRSAMAASPSIFLPGNRVRSIACARTAGLSRG